MTELIIVLCLIILLLLGFISYQMINHHKEYVKSEEWRTRMLDDLVTADKTSSVLSKNYRSLERGMDELEENYEMQILSLQEMVEAHRQASILQNNKINELSAVVEEHQTKCLPDLFTMETELYQRLQDVWAMNEDSWRAGITRA